MSAARRLVRAFASIAGSVVAASLILEAAQRRRDQAREHAKAGGTS